MNILAFFNLRAAKKPKERLARVLFDYDAVHEDELSICEGDSIVILDTELEDPGWWKGCVRGKENKVGVFPDNFVDILEPNEVSLHWLHKTIC